MNDVSVSITGLSEAMAMLAGAPKTVVAAGFLKALSAAGNVIAAELEANAPVKAEDTGGLLDRGVLRESIVVAPELDPRFRGGEVNVGFTPGNDADKVAYWLEYGHRLVRRSRLSYIDTRGRRRRGTPIGEVQPHPFIRRSAVMAEDPAIDAFVDSLRQTVTEQFPQTIAA